MLNHDVFINEFENQNFHFCDINWWPLIKVQVAYQLHLKNAHVFKLKESGKYYNEIEVKVTLKDRLQFYHNYFKTSKSVKNIIVTDSFNKDSSKRVNNVINPFTDPFIHYFEKLKIDYALFDYQKDTFLLGYDLKILKKIYLKQVKNTFNRDKEFQLQLTQFCNFLSQNYGQDFNLYQHLVHNIITNQVEYLMFLFVLQKGKVKNILLYCYYNNTMMSIIRAANKLNITTIEYQHSQVTSNHFAYSRWATNQKNNHNFFPSKMWVWRQTDAVYLKQQFEAIKKLDFIVGGNLSLNLSKVIRDKKEDAHIRVLVTLQGIGLPDYVISCIKKHPNLIMYLRLHPRYPQDKELCEMLKSKYKEQIEMEKANTLSLSEIFTSMDYHLTNFSGSAIEAEYFGLTNIIFGEKGYMTYKTEIESQKYLFVQSQEDLDIIFEGRIKHKASSKEKKIDICKLIKENFS